MSDGNLDIGTIKYVLFDSMVELWLEIMETGRQTFKPHSGIL